MHLTLLDDLIIIGYFIVVLSIGLWLRKRARTSEDFFLSGRSLPAWITGIAFMSANLGALEVMGQAANAAKYGMMSNCFYWLAIPPMCFLAAFMMPFYYGSKARSVPEYLRLRYDEKTRTLNALTFAVMTLLVGGIGLYAMAILFERMLHWPFLLSVLVAAAVVMIYVTAGGLTASIYNEVLQFFLILAGLLPLPIIGLKSIGGFRALIKKLPSPAYAHTFADLAHRSQNPMGVNWVGMVFGLGFVLGFGYWCTDFLVIQRSLAAKDMLAAQRTPLIAAVPKMLFPFILILPGLIAIALDPTLTKLLHGNYDNVIPALLGKFYPPGLLGLGLTALLASFMSGMAGNVTAFNTVWTYDIYQTHIRPARSDKHYLTMGRIATVFAVLVGIGTAFIVLRFNDLMDYLQLLFSFFNAPLFATFLLGIFWKRTTSHAAFWGLLAGILGAGLHHSLEAAGILHYRSAMAADFRLAIFSWSVCFVVTIVITLFTEPKKEKELVGLVYQLTPRQAHGHLSWHRRPGTWAIAVLAVTVALGIVFW